MPARPLPRLADFPIPRDIAPGRGWSAQMIEMAAHIGAYDTLIISERFGGREFDILADPARNPFLALIGPAKAAALSFAFRRERLAIPTARPALSRAKRASIIAAVRAWQLTVADAARIIGCRRDYASKLVNRTDEGHQADPSVAPPVARADARQMDLFC